MEFKIKTDDKPLLDSLMKTDPKLAKEIISTFVQLMEETLENNWHELPQMFSRDLTFPALIKGILHGSLDLPDINPEGYDVWKEEVHPLSMLSPRKNNLEGGFRYTDWKKHYRLPENARIDQETVATIFRRLLRYYKYVNIETLAHALINRQVKTWEGLGERNIENLPFIPALRWQQEKFSDLAVGRFLDDIGYLDGGTITVSDPDAATCPACNVSRLHQAGKYYICEPCHIGFMVETNME